MAGAGQLEIAENSAVELKNPVETGIAQVDCRFFAADAAARLALDRDPNVIALKERFDAVVQPDSVRPVR